MTTNFIRGANPIWFMANHTGQPLDDTYWAFFLTNDLPYVPQAVYQDENGISPWENPLEFQPSSGLPNNLYFDDTLVYRIEVRQGNSQTDPLIWLIENYIPGDGQGSGSDTDMLLTSENMLTNPQFADIYFESPLTISTAGTYDIAPGWQLELVGSGTVSTIITQGTTAGIEEIAGNPAYYLRFQNSGWTSATLFQRLANNGSLFSQGAVGIAFSAFATSSTETLPVYYAPSDSGTSELLISAAVNTGSFQQFGNAIDLPVSTNTDTGTAGYVDIQFAMPGQSDISISNVQFTGQENSLVTSPLVPVYQEIPYARMVDHEFNVYRDSIILQPKDSVLVAWNFAQNPWQNFLTSGQTINGNEYSADQTIVIQQQYVATATGSNVAVKQGSAGNNYCYTVTALTAHNQFAIVQYIDAFSIMPYWGMKMSALVKAFLNTTHSSNVKVKMRLFYSVSLPASTSQHVPVDSWTEGGDPVFAGGTTAIIPRFDPAYTLGSTSDEFSFDAFQMPSNAAATQTLGVMVYTVGNMSESATADSIVFQDVSLVPNDFAIASNPKSFDETLRECQYYFETSYAPFVKPGTVAETAYSFTQNLVFNSGGGGSWDMYPTPFSLQFETKKRAVPSDFSVFSPTAGTTNLVDVAMFQGSSTATVANTVAFSTNFDATLNLVDRGLVVLPNSGNTILTTAGASGDLHRVGIVSFHWAANSQLGA